MSTSANDSTLKSFVNVEKGSDFPIQNLPFGIGVIDGEPRVVSAIGDKVVDLVVLHEMGYLNGLSVHEGALRNPYLNEFISLGKPATNETRSRLSEILREGSEAASDAQYFLRDMEEVNMLIPVKIGDYTDFYSSREHATNVGTMFRGKENALKPNWVHLPVGYHGRASSVVVSGTDIHRPIGQLKKGDNPPIVGASERLDFELEVGFIVGDGTALGDRIGIDEAEDHIFGLCMFNDWSARDIQVWEYVPLGPFLGKSFGSTMSPWIVTLEALEPFRCPSPEQSPEVLDYLKYKGDKSYDIHLEVEMNGPGEKPTTICKSNFKYMYWTMVQQLAHHSINGCNFNVGDLCASGTISGKTPDSYGSLLELSWNGENPLKLNDGTTRTFIQDRDTINLKGYAEKDGVRIGFGDCKGTILPAKP